MAFPGDNIRAEMLINGTWTDVTSRVRGNGDIRITSGTRVDSTDLAPTTCDFALNNRDGLFTNDNPLSTYYGLLPVNTNFRLSMKESTPFLYLPNGITTDPSTGSGWTSSWIETADKSVLDVTGDLDLRIDIEPDTWQLGNVGHILAGKAQLTSNQTSWAWSITGAGLLRFQWTTGGSTLLTAESTVVVPATGRISLRMTMDVNNGASGNTVTFYTSNSVTGTWTQLGAAVVTAGTTSIFSGSAPLQVGAIYDSSAALYYFSLFSTPILPLVGRVHRFQMYNGIAGTLVADMNATAQAENTSSWSDGLTTPNTWTCKNSAVVTVADYRAYTELADMPQEWDATGRDVYVNIDSAGISRRITKDPKVVQSAFRRYNEALTTKSGYWAMEDASGTLGAFTSVAGARLSGFVGLGYGSSYSPPGSSALADVTSADSFIVYNFSRASTTAGVGWQIGWVARYQPFTANPTPILITMDCADGTDIVVTLDVATKTIETFAQTSTGTILKDLTTTYTDDFTEWHSFVLKFTQSGGNISLELDWRSFDATSWSTLSGAYAGTTSPLLTARFGGGDVPPGSTIGHVIGLVGTTEDLASETRFSAFLGYLGETAATRWLRICRENNIRGLCIGWPADSTPMGPQQPDTVVRILDECAATDGGMQYDARDQPALVLRTRTSLYAQQAGCTLDYTLAHLSGAFRPRDDDLLTKNNVTATNPDGSFATSTITSGPKSTASSPNGVGEYPSSVSVNTSTTTQLAYAAQDATFRGTWPGRRVPSVQAQLARDPYTASATLTRAVRSLNPGDRLDITNVPIWVGGGTQETLVRTYVELIQNSGSARGWLLDFGTVPGGPFSSVPQLGNDQLVPRLDATATTTGGSLTTTATSVTFVTPAGSAVWVDSTGYSAEFPMTVNIDGEWMTVTAISGTTSPQTATLTRSVNAIVKTHSSGASVFLAKPYYVGR